MPSRDLRGLKCRFVFPFLTFLFLLLLNYQAKGQEVESVLLLDVITKIQDETPYRFLYRESLVSPVRVSLDLYDDGVFDELSKQLKPHGIDVRVDSIRYQVLFLQASDVPAQAGLVDVSGQVVDAQTGERLPYATITWTEVGSTKGIAAGNNGSFRIIRDSFEPYLNARFSYLGYETAEIIIDVVNNPRTRGITVRLTPKVISGTDILVTGHSYYVTKDSSLAGLIDASQFSPLGETNAIRALQVLPSSSLTTAMNDGLNIRGSNPDGFQVFLDGMSIFNQSHLFGLLDSFNADAIQTNYYFYDVTPAHFQSSTGGTLSLLTRTGSQQGLRANTGASNSSLKATVEGPIKRGRSSWLISARNSYMNSLSWFNNADLIKWGLDINRPKRVLGDDLTDLNSELVEPGESEAQFFDLHGKIYHEGRAGNRLMVSAYFGGDRTHQNAFRQARTLSEDNEFVAQDVETANDWGNFVGTVHYQHELTDQINSYSMAGISAYETSYSKDDFVYTRLSSGDETNQMSMFTYPFTNQSTLNEFKVEQKLDIIFSSIATTIGTTYLYYLGDYLEDSFDRQGFFTRMRSSQIDAFIQADLLQTNPLHLEVGSRFHYYAMGKYLKWSPRLRLRLFPEADISLGAGFSRNYQFLHRVGLENAVTSDVWILSDSNQPPSSVNHFSTGVYIQPIHHTYLQVEAYLKHYENLRLHEINTQTFTNAFANIPWFYENSGNGKGIETLMRNQVTPFVSLTQTYTLSSIELQNPYLYDNVTYYADWDRRHRYSSTVELELVKDFLVNLSWNYATGSPNRLAESVETGQERLRNYSRFDLSMQYARQFSQSKLELKFSLFNLFNHQNIWYREYNLAIDNGRSTPRLVTVPMDVYELGFQPSFEIGISF